MTIDDILLELKLTDALRPDEEQLRLAAYLRQARHERDDTVASWVRETIAGACARLGLLLDRGAVERAAARHADDAHSLS